MAPGYCRADQREWHANKVDWFGTVLMDDFLIIDVGATLAASKQLSYKNSVRAMYQALAVFLQTNQLTTHALVNDDEQISDDLVIRRSDLTDVGFELIKGKLDYWLDRVSTARTASGDMSILEAELQVVLSSQGDNS
ncbi:hypothetical protein KOR34_41680 [Posidoniimonas corsicana]|uniref:Uncharacterized protein n=1 Tax=Posidoniimonas corsicana TaxID=1938618 RepID=A0A5C5V3Y6_9BACT|nr:hypothetical protein [Posidoniimonas corsicana]TWT32405.1 hypothetical protein KOR34_41680 [Posidoniimonas corsicana]